MFFDEVNAWGISAASPTLSKLFYYVHYEGHPWLWYFILWFPSRLTHDPVALKWVEAALGTAIIVVIGTLTPFTYKQRALILSGYFLVWEYTVMCRMYSVMLLLTLIYLWRRSRISDGVMANCVLLGLIGNTDMTGVLLSGALLTEYAYSSLRFGAPAARATGGGAALAAGDCGLWCADSVRGCHAVAVEGHQLAVVRTPWITGLFRSSYRAIDYELDCIAMVANRSILSKDLLADESTCPAAVRGSDCRRVVCLLESLPERSQSSDSDSCGSCAWNCVR